MNKWTFTDILTKEIIYGKQENYLIFETQNLNVN